MTKIHRLADVNSLARFAKPNDLIRCNPIAFFHLDKKSIIFIPKKASSFDVSSKYCKFKVF
jgi:hypothetical protein